MTRSTVYRVLYSSSSIVTFIISGILVSKDSQSGVYWMNPSNRSILKVLIYLTSLKTYKSKEDNRKILRWLMFTKEGKYILLLEDLQRETRFLKGCLQTLTSRRNSWILLLQRINLFTWKLESISVYLKSQFSWVTFWWICQSIKFRNASQFTFTFWPS